MIPLLKNWPVFVGADFPAENTVSGRRARASSGNRRCATTPFLPLFSPDEFLAKVSSARIQEELFIFRQRVVLLIPNFLAAFVLQNLESSSAFCMKAAS